LLSALFLARLHASEHVALFRWNLKSPPQTTHFLMVPDGTYARSWRRASLDFFQNTPHAREHVFLGLLPAAQNSTPHATQTLVTAAMRLLLFLADLLHGVEQKFCGPRGLNSTPHVAHDLVGRLAARRRFWTVFSVFRQQDFEQYF
jgi:hypothetical protein